MATPNTVPLVTAAPGYFDIWAERGKQAQFLTTDIEKNVSYPKELYPKRNGFRVRTISSDAGITLVPSDFGTGMLVLNNTSGTDPQTVNNVTLPTTTALLAYFSAELDLPPARLVTYPDNPTVTHTAFQQWEWCFKLAVSGSSIAFTAVADAANWIFQYNGVAVADIPVPPLAPGLILAPGEYEACITRDTGNILTLNITGSIGLGPIQTLPRFPLGEVIDNFRDGYITWNNSNQRWEYQLWQELISGQSSAAAQTIKQNPQFGGVAPPDRAFDIGNSVFVGWEAGPDAPAAGIGFITCVGFDTGNNITTEAGIICLGINSGGVGAGTGAGVISGDDTFYLPPGMTIAGAPAANDVTYNNVTGEVVFSASASVYKKDLAPREVSKDLIEKIDELHLMKWIWQTPQEEDGKIVYDIKEADIGISAQEIHDKLGSDFAQTGDIKVGDHMLHANAALGFKKNALMGYLIEVIKDARSEIRDLRARVASLESAH